MAASVSVLDSQSTIFCDPALFSENFNKLPFEVEHALTSDPRFEPRGTGPRCR